MISIIIATYNRAKFLPRSINSILAQTHKDWELIVVDDGSSDQTESLFLKEFNDPRIKYFKLDENQGATYARNYGLERVSGDYFLVWDSDDVLYPNALEKVLDGFSTQANLAVVSAAAKTLHHNREVAYPAIPTGLLPYEDVVCRILPPSNDKVKLVNAQICKDIRYKAKNIDFLVNVEFGQRGGWWHINEYLGEVNVEVDELSLTAKRRKPNVDMSKLRSIFLYDYLMKFGHLMKERCPHQYAAFAYGASLGLLLSGRHKDARTLFKDSVIYSDRNIRYRLIYYFSLLPISRPLLWFLFKLKGFFLTIK